MTDISRRKLFAAGAAGAAGLAAGAATVATTPAAAQTAPAAQDDAVEEVVVTGSRVVSNGNQAPTPVTVVATERLLQTTPTNIPDALNRLPQFAAQPATRNIGNSQGNATGSFLNLRRFGSNRNLVLFDGSRVPPTANSGAVDTNVIPQSLIQRVEIVTGGASAVYGSDAMSGVVNFKTRSNFTGIQLDAQYGNAFKMDRATRDINLTAGGRFADDKGFGVLSLGYTDREALSGADRKFYERGTLSSFLGYGAYAPAATNLPSQAAVNAIFATKYGVTTAVSRSNPIGTNDDQTLFTLTGAQNYRGRTTGDYVIDAGNVRYPYAISRDILNSIKRRSLYSKFTYDFTENLQGYMQVLYTNAETSSNGGTSLTQFGTLPTIPLTNPFIPADLRTILASRPNPTAAFDFNGRYVGLPVKMNLDRNTTYQFLFGIKGTLPVKDWAWDLYASADRTEGNYTTSRGVLLDRVQSVFNSTTGGADLCTGGYNPFGDANARKVSQSCIDYLTANINSNEVVKQHVVEGSITGTLFALAAGLMWVSMRQFRRVSW